MTTQLAVFNRVLTALSARRLASLVEPREPQRVLTDLWPDCVQFCLEAGMWNFAMKTVALASSGPGSMGEVLAFNKPADFVHLFAAALTGSFDQPLVDDLIDQGAGLYASNSPLYIRYISNDASSGGGNPALWTMTFTTYVVHVLASWSALRITGSQELGDVMEARAKRYLVHALAVDSVRMLPGMLPFSAEARAVPLEGMAPQQLDTRPFIAAAGGAEAAQGRGEPQ